VRLHVETCPHNVLVDGVEAGTIPPHMLDVLPIELHDHVDCPLVGKAGRGKKHGDEHAQLCEACGVEVMGDPAS
jgi:hypothetical protein